MKKSSSFVGMDSNLLKVDRLSALYDRVMEIDNAVKKLDEIARLALDGQATVSIDIVAVKGTPQVIQEEFNIPPVYVPGYPPITSILLPKSTNTTVDRLLMPEAITLSMIGTVVAHYNVERKLIIEEIDSILNPNARPKSKAKTVPVGRVRQ